MGSHCLTCALTVIGTRLRAVSGGSRQGTGTSVKERERGREGERERGRGRGREGGREEEEAGRECKYYT